MKKLFSVLCVIALFSSVITFSFAETQKITLDISAMQTLATSKYRVSEPEAIYPTYYSTYAKWVDDLNIYYEYTLRDNYLSSFKFEGISRTGKPRYDVVIELMSLIQWSCFNMDQYADFLNQINVLMDENVKTGGETKGTIKGLEISVRSNVLNASSFFSVEITVPES